MNCRPNDLAWFLGHRECCPICAAVSDAARDHIVRVTTFDEVEQVWHFEEPIAVEGFADLPTPFGTVRARFKAKVVAAADDVLRPIRPSDGIDEAIRIAGKPDPVREELREIRREMSEEPLHQALGKITSETCRYRFGGMS